jgi:hypothetical protein
VRVARVRNRHNESRIHRSLNRAPRLAESCQQEPFLQLAGVNLVAWIAQLEVGSGSGRHQALAAGQATEAVSLLPLSIMEWLF